MADIVEAAKSGDHREALIALRDRLAEGIVKCDSNRDLAALSKRFMDVLNELEGMPTTSNSALRRAQEENIERLRAAHGARHGVRIVD